MCFNEWENTVNCARAEDIHIVVLVYCCKHLLEWLCEQHNRTAMQCGEGSCFKCDSEKNNLQ
jgi:hypothetical protein